MKKPRCRKRISNLIQLIGVASDCLLEHGQKKEAIEMQRKCLEADEKQVMEIVNQYVTIG